MYLKNWKPSVSSKSIEVEYLLSLGLPTNLLHMVSILRFPLIDMGFILSPHFVLKIMGTELKCLQKTHIHWVLGINN